jgi:hypothetical protein
LWIFKRYVLLQSISQQVLPECFRIQNKKAEDEKPTISLWEDFASARADASVLA